MYIFADMYFLARGVKEHMSVTDLPSSTHVQFLARRRLRSKLSLVSLIIVIEQLDNGPLGCTALEVGAHMRNCHSLACMMSDELGLFFFHFLGSRI
jgi:hypothetical protein